MSVSYDIKREILTQQYKSVCCRRALLSGIAFAKGVANDKEITLSLQNDEYADFATNLITEQYGKLPHRFRAAKGGRQIFLSFNSTALAKNISHLSDGTIEHTIETVAPLKCSGCQSAFLKGIFLVSGTVSDPKKQFSLEFHLGERADVFAQLLINLGMSPKIARRKNGDIVYFHTNYGVEDFFAYAGINHVVFNVIEAKITSLAKLETQRFVNCVTYNYNRMVDVSERQLAIIKRLAELELLSSLPDELESTARMRMEYSDLPLSALAAKMTPAISKSGLSHRLKRIEELGARLLKLDTN